MKNLFIVGLKLLGILCLYSALGEIAQIGIALTSAPSLQKMGIQPAWHIFSIAMFALVELLFALVLLIRSKEIADFLKVQDTSAAPGQVTPAVLLYTLLITVSVFILLQAVPQIIRILVHWIYLRQGGRYVDDYTVAEFVAAVSQVILALIVILRMKAMARQLLPPIKDALAQMKSPGE